MKRYYRRLVLEWMQGQGLNTLLKNSCFSAGFLFWRVPSCSSVKWYNIKRYKLKWNQKFYLTGRKWLPPTALCFLPAPHHPRPHQVPGGMLTWGPNFFLKRKHRSHGLKAVSFYLYRTTISLENTPRVCTLACSLGLACHFSVDADELAILA